MELTPFLTGYELQGEEGCEKKGLGGTQGIKGIKGIKGIGSNIESKKGIGSENKNDSYSNSPNSPNSPQTVTEVIFQPCHYCGLPESCGYDQQGRPYCELCKDHATAQKVGKLCSHIMGLYLSFRNKSFVR